LPTPTWKSTSLTTTLQRLFGSQSSRDQRQGISNWKIPFHPHWTYLWGLFQSTQLAAICRSAHGPFHLVIKRKTAGSGIRGLSERRRLCSSTATRNSLCKSKARPLKPRSYDNGGWFVSRSSIFNACQ
jgi:hypothetical protein